MIEPVIKGETLVPYQREAIRFLHKNRKVLLDGAIGSGKTVMCTVASNIEHLKDPKTKTLVVCPPIMKNTWIRELEKWAKPLIKKFRLVDFNTGRVKLCLADTHVVVPYSLAHKEQVLREILDWLSASSNRTVIIDESHKLRSPTIKTTIQLHSILLPHVDNLYYASGTPLVRGPCDIYTTKCGIENEPVTLRGYMKYAATYMYSSMDRYSPTGVKYYGARPDKIPEFKAWMKKNSFKITKEQVEKELPPLTIREVFLKLKPFKGKPIPMATERMLTALRKLPSVIEYIDDVLEDRDSKKDPLIIFGYTVDVMHELYAHLKKKGYKISFVIGSTSNVEKSKAQHDFQSGITDIYLGGITSGGIGITLTRANEMILTELHWNSVDVDQVIGRINRISQKRNMIATCLIAEGTVEEAILKVMKEKAKTIKKVS